MSLLKFNYHNCNNKRIIKTFNELIKSSKNNIKFKDFIFSLPFVKIIEEDSEIREIKKLSKKFIKHNNSFCICGTGGSSLGAQALFGLLSKQKSKNFHFYDNIDPLSFANNLNHHNFSKTGFIIISKSGFTIETLGQLGAILKKIEDLKLTSNISKHFIILTEKKNSPLTYIAKNFNIPLLFHNKNIGGRFSVFSNVALLPAFLAGIDIDEIKKGAKSILKELIKDNYNESYKGAALSIAMHKKYNANINVMLTYSDALLNFGNWYRQLWAESIGKNGMGTTPINFIGTLDQHSQIQLYLDGPKDKFFTFIKTEHANKGLLVHSDIFIKCKIDYLAGKKMGDLMEAEQNATLQTLINNKLPVREIFIKKINAKSLGALMMHFLLETVSAGIMLKVNPFNQPAVEQGKKLTNKYLSSN